MFLLKYHLGNVVLFVPPSFSGIVRMQTRNGSLDILPGIANRIKVAKQTEQEVMFMLEGDSEPRGYSRQVSYCELTSRHGNVVVHRS